ncbi:MAG: DUF4321 domain-containing protein [candidate division KSB1 bacterium]|jgi:hypothetical protein|nr:DUF4321 domain-containing protein [candidate division KSB1 bacterium]
MNKKPLSFVIFVILLGAILGTAIGELIAFILPSGVVEEFFIKSALFGFEPFTINAGVISFTLGFTFKLNIVGIIGIAFSAYLLRWYKNHRYL